ncbi:MAG: aspartate--tRNA ligase [bacterium]
MLKTAMRTCLCGEVDAGLEGSEVTLCGWVNRKRDHGNLIFIDLRDRSGIVQLFPDNEDSSETMKSLRSEDVIRVKGIVKRRPENVVNKDMKTGEVEVECHFTEVISRSAVTPFVIEEDVKASEELRLKYRYLDLRRKYMTSALIMRSKVIKSIRDFLTDCGFIEIETPVMSKSTPEGARDYLVPSRMHAGKFYSLVQSPQLYKQILMVSGFDRYFQIARCFRDEDQRADRQPEFTQLDMEMSFVSSDDVLQVIEEMMAHIFKETLGIELKIPFRRMTYDESMEKYGSDKPDLRYKLEINDITESAHSSEFQVFREQEFTGAILSDQDFTRKEIDELTEFVKSIGATGLGYMKLSETGVSGPLSKYLPKEILNNEKILFAMSGKKKRTLEYLGMLRRKIASIKKFDTKDEFNFVWVVEFPLFEYDENEQRYVACHHMFTMPKKEHLSTMSTEPLKARGDLYDLVLNGVELASGSIRIHDPKIQKEIMKIVGMTDEELQSRFGFLLEAFKYGAPPHGGIAPGIDRLVSLMLKRDNIKDVIAFPKTLNGLGLMEESPDFVSDKQLKELHLKTEK